MYSKVRKPSATIGATDFGVLSMRQKGIECANSAMCSKEATVMVLPIFFSLLVKMVFCYQFIQTVKVQNNFWYQSAFRLLPVVEVSQI